MGQSLAEKASHHKTYIMCLTPAHRAQGFGLLGFLSEGQPPEFNTALNFPWFRCGSPRKYREAIRTEKWMLAGQAMMNVCLSKDVKGRKRLTHIQKSRNVAFFFKILSIHNRQRGRDTGRGRSRLHAGSLRAWHGTRSWVSSIMPWAEGRCQTSEPPSDPQGMLYLKSNEKTSFLPPNSFFVQFLKFYHLGIFFY